MFDLQGLSKSALVAWLARLAPGGRRVALANRTDGSAYEAPTRWVADQALLMPKRIGAIDRSRALCAKALGYQAPGALSFGLLAQPSSAAQAQGQASPALNPGRAAAPWVGPRVVVLVHGSSRADKQWPVAAWQGLGQRLIDSGFSLALPHGNDAEEQQARQIARGLLAAHVWPRQGLDALSDAMAGCAGVVGVDSGLSHIAVALGLAHVQIYNFDTAWRTGPTGLARQCSVYRQPTPTVDQVWLAWQAVYSGAVCA